MSLSQGVAATHSKLEHMPVSLFATVMGLAGLAIASEQASALWGWGPALGHALTTVSLLVYLFVAGFYGLKLMRYPAAVTQEFNHPIRLSFFPASSIGLILLAVSFLPMAPNVSLYFWAIGGAGQLLFTLIILSNWMHHDRFQIQHSNPAWFIPIVGNILVPIAGVPLGYSEVSWFFFSIGLLMWLPLLAVLLNRFFFHPMMPAKLLPTLFIMIAPPAVGFLSWLTLHGGQLDDAGRLLYYFALFNTLLMLTQAKYFLAVPFALPWWAYSFPVAAITVATMHMYQLIGGTFYAVLSMVLYAGLVILLFVLVKNTIKAMRAGKVCAPE